MQLALINLTQLTRDEQRESHDPGTLLGHDKKLLLNIVSCPTVPVELWAPIGWTMVAATLGRRFLVRKGRFWGKLLLLSHMPHSLLVSGPVISVLATSRAIWQIDPCAEILIRRVSPVHFFCLLQSKSNMSLISSKTYKYGQAALVSFTNMSMHCGADLSRITPSLSSTAKMCSATSKWRIC
jgi:hypothetical protein